VTKLIVDFRNFANKPKKQRFPLDMPRGFNWRGKDGDRSVLINEAVDCYDRIPSALDELNKSREE
jgi:hypothetical protein